MTEETENKSQKSFDNAIRKMPYILDPRFEWVIGFTGPTGGGKTIGAAYWLCVDALIRGKPVFSYELPVSITIQHQGITRTFSSEPLEPAMLYTLDERLRRCVLFYDEMNLSGGDSRRSMSTKNITFNYALQQKRKLRASLLYTVIQENWIDPRTRQLTDIYVRCGDLCLRPWGQDEGLDRGEVFSMDILDWSGQLTGKPYLQYPVSTNYTFYGKRFWPLVDSYNLIDIITAQAGVEIQQSKMQIKVGEDAKLQKQSALHERIFATLSFLKESGHNEIRDNELWNIMDTSEDEKRQVGIQLKQFGVTKKQRRDGYHYILPSFIDDVHKNTGDNNKDSNEELN